MTEITPTLSRGQALGLAAALTVMAATMPSSDHVVRLYGAFGRGIPGMTYSRFADALLILVGLALTLPSPRASGLCIGDIQSHWWKVLLLTGVPIVGCAFVYPMLPVQPFRGSDISLWLTSPLAQDLIFGGVIYRLLRPHFRSKVHPRLPFEWALPVGGLFFAAWHLQNLAYFPVNYVVFQLGYTWLAYTVIGLTRQWTGSLLYVTLAHSAGNFSPWYYGQS